MKIMLAVVLTMSLILPAYAEQVATLQTFTGPVTVQPKAGAAWIAATANMALDREATVKAGAGATAKILATNGRSFQMRPNSQMAVRVLLVTVPASQQLQQLRTTIASQPASVQNVTASAGVRGEGIDEARVNHYLVWEESVTEEDQQVQQIYNNGIGLLKGGLVDEALQQFQLIISDYKTSSFVDDAAYMVANIYERDLKAADVALFQYRQFVETYPRSQFRFAAERAIARLAPAAAAPAAAAAAPAAAPANE